MEPIELRCGGTLHGIMREPTHLEVKCKRRSCGVRPGVVVLHTFDIQTGELTQTRRFRDPAQEGNIHASSRGHYPVRAQGREAKGD